MGNVSGNAGGISAGSNASKPGYSVINKFGENLDIDGADVPVEIWSHGADGTNFPFIDAGIAMDIVSTSANDTVGGTGGEIARVTYYNTDNTENVVDFGLNGLARVAIDDDVKFVSRIQIIETGASMANEGAVDVVDRATGLVVYQSVEIGDSQTQSAIQICPKGKVGEVVRTKVGYAKDQNPLGSADMRFRLRLANGTMLTKHPVVISAIKPSDTEEPKSGSVATLAAGDIVFWECTAVSADNTPIEARFDMELFDA